MTKLKAAAKRVIQGRKPKVFVLSLHRSMTRSTYALLKEAGLRACWWPRRYIKTSYAGRADDLDFVFDSLKSVADEFDALADVPVPVLYRQLHAHYAHARFILVYRNPFDWVRSIRTHIGDRDFGDDEKVQYWAYFPVHPRRIADLTDTQLCGMYLRHYSNIIAYFHEQGAAEKLCLVDIADPECGQKICRFLGVKKVLSMPYVRDPEKTNNE